LGFNLLIYDQRNSGDNGAETNTCGVLESYEHLDAIDYGKKNFKGNIIVYGESLGAASSLIGACRDDKNIDYLILDSPVSDSNYMIDKELKKVERNSIPVDYMKFTGNIFLKANLSYDLDDVNTINWLKKSDLTCPVLLISGDKDEISFMAEDIYENIVHNKKEIYTGENIGHIELSEKNPSKFKKIVTSFLGKY